MNYSKDYNLMMVLSTVGAMNMLVYMASLQETRLSQVLLDFFMSILVLYTWSLHIKLFRRRIKERKALRAFYRQTN